MVIKLDSCEKSHFCRAGCERLNHGQPAQASLRPDIIDGTVAVKVAVQDVPCAPVEEGEAEVQVEGEEFQCEPCEVEPLKEAPSPQKPSAADVKEHRVKHIPYRSWCRECVEGKALGEQRGHAKDACESKIAVVGADYFFTTAKGAHHKTAEAMMELDFTEKDALTAARLECKVVKNIIVRCPLTKLISAHQVPVKGVDEDRHVA